MPAGVVISAREQVMMPMFGSNVAREQVLMFGRIVACQLAVSIYM